jgi:hypothetical protein
MQEIVNTMPHLAKVSFVAVAAASVISGTASANSLAGEDLRRLVSGRTVYLSAPLGGEFPLKYNPNGSVTGDGQAVGLGRFYAARETGRWFMQGNNLCQQFPTWYGGTRLCFSVQDMGNRKIRWIRDNGDTGIARVADQ